MTGIFELFAELDGSDRYWEALAMEREKFIAETREYHRDRLRFDLRARAGQREAKKRYRRRLDPLVGTRRKGIEAHGYSMYAKRGCRCETCRAASAAYMRARRARLKEAA